MAHAKCNRVPEPADGPMGPIGGGVAFAIDPSNRGGPSCPSGIFVSPCLLTHKKCKGGRELATAFMACHIMLSAAVFLVGLFTAGTTSDEGSLCDKIVICLKTSQ